MQNQSDSDHTVSGEVNSWKNHSTIPFASNERLFLLHRLRNIDFANLGPNHTTTKRFRNVINGLGCREVGDNCPSFLAQDKLNGQSQRILFPYRQTLFADDREPIGV